MEETATIQMAIPRLHPPITLVAVPTIQVAVVITRHRPGTTRPPRGITSQHRVITISRASINRPRAITNPGAITGLIRIRAGTVIIEVAGIMTTKGTKVTGTMAAEEAGIMTIEGVDAITTGAAITWAEAATGNRSNKSGASSAAFFMPGFQYSDKSANGCRPSQTL